MKPSFLHRAGVAPAQSFPLLFVHGAFAGAWCWDEHFVPYFQSRGYDCIALDFRGHGFDPGWLKIQLLRIQDYVQDLAWAVERCPSPPVLIAHSMGGFVALRLLRRHKTKLAGLVLMSPGSEKSHRAAALQMLQRHPLLCYKLQLMNCLPKPWWPWVMNRAEIRRLMLSDASSLDTPEQVLPKMQHESFWAIMDMLRPTSHESPDLRCPVLALSGSEDIIVPPEFVRRTAEWLQADMRIVPHMGHSMMLEDGWRTVAELISEWLSARVSNAHEITSP